MKKCPSCNETVLIIKKGYFPTKWNHKLVPRYQCKSCRKYFSASTAKDTYKQHKPNINGEIFKLICSGVTLRRTAVILGLSKNTVLKKMTVLTKKARLLHKQNLEKIKTGYVQFDEMETFEETKLKPLSIALAIRPKTGEIIDIKVAPMKARSSHSDISRKLYGWRPDLREKACREVMETVKSIARSNITVVSDAKTWYPRVVKEVIPNATHSAHVSRKDSDAMFTLNVVAAKIRSDLARMARRTWCTTKKMWRLQEHLELYIAWNNKYAIE